MKEFIIAVITPEINNELTACPDGMTVMFFKHYWNIIYEDVVKEVQDFFQAWKDEVGVQSRFPTSNPIFSDILSRMIVEAEEQGKISGVKVTSTNPKITHLMYADNVVIYGKGDGRRSDGSQGYPETILFMDWTRTQLDEISHTFQLQCKRNTQKGNMQNTGYG